MENDILGCIIPNNPDHYVLLNDRRFLQRPHEHLEKTQKSQEPKMKKMKLQIPVENSFFSLSTTPKDLPETSSSN